MEMAAGRRLLMVAGHIMPPRINLAASDDDAELATDQTVVTAVDDSVLEMAAAALAAGELDPRQVPRKIVHELMRPQPGFLGYPDRPTETERLLKDARAVDTRLPVRMGSNFYTLIFESSVV